MSDVFVSYASEDRERVRDIARALEARGWTVWWDRKIIAGQSFDMIIERELEQAKSVVVLWSTNSISSEWVKNEAAAAAQRSRLVPALIDDVKIPLEFRRRQTASLVGWEGDPSGEGFQTLCDGVQAAISGTTAADSPIGQPQGFGVFDSARQTSGVRASRGDLTRLGVVGAGLVLGSLVLWKAFSLSPAPAPGREPKIEARDVINFEQGKQRSDTIAVKTAPEKDQPIVADYKPAETPPADDDIAAAKQSQLEEELVRTKEALHEARVREEEHEKALKAAVDAAQRAQAAAEQANQASRASADREAAQARAEAARQKAEEAKEKAESERTERRAAEVALLSKEREADQAQASAASGSGGDYQAGARLPIIGYVMFAVIDKQNRPRKVYFSIDGKPDARFPSPNDIITPIITPKRDKVALRGEPFRWDFSRNANVPAGPELVYLRSGQKIRVGGDVFISSDHQTGEQYAIAPITEAVNFQFDSRNKSVFTLDRSTSGIAGYVYLGMIDDRTGEFVSKYFENETRPNAIYPAPNDRLRATKDVNLRAGPRYWDAARGDYVNSPKVGDTIKAGQVIQIGGDAILSRGGQTIWVPVSSRSLN